jgi:outer membrane protein assembly factor BamB
VAVVALGTGLAIGRGASTTADSPTPAGTPSELTENLSYWATGNGNYTNDRSAIGSQINAGNLNRLKKAWSYKISAKPGPFGVFAANPVGTKSAVYLQDIDSNVQALDRNTGEVLWQHRFNSPSVGPNGVVIADGMIIGNTGDSTFALNQKTGKQMWKTKLIGNKWEGLDIQPIVWNHTVYTSTIPGNAKQFYHPGASGVIYALNDQTGKVQWKFRTTVNNLWGHPEVNSGGGSWWPMAIDAQGHLYASIANPAPWPGSKKYPNGSSRKGSTLYSDTLIALDAKTGKLLWHNQVIKHDIRDYDLHLSPILATVDSGGAQKQIVVTGGKMGTVYAMDRATGKLLWKRDVGTHNKWGNPELPLPHHKVTVYPSILGGVEVPMAYKDGVVYAAVNNLCALYTWPQKEDGLGLCPFNKNTGELDAIDAATGKILWKKTWKSGAYSAPIVVNNVIFNVTYAGVLSAYNLKSGKLLKSWKLPNGVNANLAVGKNDLIVAPAVQTGNTPAAVTVFKLK